MTWLLPLMLLPPAVAMLFSPGGRFFLVTAAGLVVFTPGHADLTTKVAFVALVLASTVTSLLRLRNEQIGADRSLVAAAAAYGASLMVAALVGWTDDIPATLQEGLPYLLPLLLLPVAIDAGRGTSRELLETGMLAVGLISALSFMVFWLDRRHISTLALNQVFAASFLMPALVFQWGIVTAVTASRTWVVRVPAMAAAVFIAVAFLITGTRTSIILVAGLLALVIWRSTKGRFLRVLMGLTAVGAIFLPLLNLFASVLLTRPDFVSSRIASLLKVLTYGSAADASWQARQLSTQAAQIALEGHWLFGTGLSTPDPLLLSFDTPLSTVMRLGLVGTASAIIFIVVALRYSIRGGNRSEQNKPAQGVIMGWLLIVVVLSTLLSPFDDSLFAFAFATAVALGINSQELDGAHEEAPSTLRHPLVAPHRTLSRAGLGHPDGPVRQIVNHAGILNPK